jgi:hypothetical protein
MRILDPESPLCGREEKMTITSLDAQYAFDIVKAICTKVGPGLPGSTQEWERAAMIKEELESHLGAGNVVLEAFTLAPWACFGALRISALFMLIAALLNVSIGRFTGVPPWLTALGALAFSILSPLLFVSEDILGFEIIDPLFKKAQSVNVIGTLRKPGSGNAKRLLIISGHHDSAAENTWLRFLGYGFLVLTSTQAIAFITLVALSLFQLVGVITGDAGLVQLGTLGWVLLAYPIVPAIVFALFFNMGTKGGGTVPGAVDNLSASALAAAICRFLVENPACIPDDTEIRFISFGSEEAGLRGSRCYVKRHLEELKRLDARLLNVEMVAHPEIGILTSDMNGTVKHCLDTVKSVAAAAQRAGVPHKVKSGHLGIATDAVPFSRAGLGATTLLPFKVPQQTVAFYHQKWDTPKKLTVEPLFNVLKLASEWIRTSGQ